MKLVRTVFVSMAILAAVACAGRALGESADESSKAWRLSVGTFSVIGGTSGHSYDTGFSVALDRTVRRSRAYDTVVGLRLSSYDLSSSPTGESGNVTVLDLTGELHLGIGRSRQAYAALGIGPAFRLSDPRDVSTGLVLAAALGANFRSGFAELRLMDTYSTTSQHTFGAGIVWETALLFSVGARF